MAYVPDRGDLVWLNSAPQTGREQAGRRPALVLSPETYNSRVGLAIFCPVTTHIKGYPFEVRLPEDFTVSGVILADQVRSLDWRARQAVFIAKSPEAILLETLQRLNRLLLI